MCTNADEGDDSFLIVEPSCMQAANNGNSGAFVDLLADGGQLLSKASTQQEVFSADLLRHDILY